MNIGPGEQLVGRRCWRVALVEGGTPFEELARAVLGHAGADGWRRLVSLSPLDRAFVVRLADDEAKALRRVDGVRSVTLDEDI